MKKQLLYLSILSVLLWNPLAEASRSRLNALGQNGGTGSLYIKDARNMFLNPAQINTMKQQANFEWGATASNATPKAEGGLVHGTGSMLLGVQLGRVGEAAQDASNGITQSGVGLTNFPQNSLELTFGSEGGMTWGGALHYVSNDNKTESAAVADTESQIITAKFGIINNNIQAYVHADVVNTTESEVSGVTGKYDGGLTLRLGGSMELASGDLLGLQIDRQAFDYDNGGATEGEGEYLDVLFNYHRPLKTTETDLFYYSLGLRYSDQDTKPTGGASVSDEVLALPLAIGFETKAKDWMILRASITQEVIINKFEDGSANTETNNADDTVVAAGFGLIWNESLSMDATFAGSTNGNFNATNMFGNVGMNYSF